MHLKARFAIYLLLCSAPLAWAQTYLGDISFPAAPFYISDLAVNPGTNRIYVAGSNEGEIYVLDGNTRAYESTIETGYVYAMSIAVNPLTDRIYVGAQHDPAQVECSVLVIDGNTNKVIDTIFVSQGGSLQSIAVNPLTNRIYVADTINSTVSVISGASDRILHTIKLKNAPLSLAVNPFTNRVFAASKSTTGLTYEIDGKTYDILHSISIGRPVNHIEVDVVNNHFFVLAPDSANSPGAIYVMDGAKNHLLTVIHNFNYSIAIDPTTNRLWAVNTSYGPIPTPPTASLSLIDMNRNLVISSVSLGTYQYGKVVVDPITHLGYVLGGLSDVYAYSPR